MIGIKYYNVFISKKNIS